jgi:hypothetical protein
LTRIKLWTNASKSPCRGGRFFCSSVGHTSLPATSTHQMTMSLPRVKADMFPGSRSVSLVGCKVQLENVCYKMEVQVREGDDIPLPHIQNFPYQCNSNIVSSLHTKTRKSIESFGGQFPPLGFLRQELIDDLGTREDRFVSQFCLK